jgi:hypothetical protein
MPEGAATLRHSSAGSEVLTLEPPTSRAGDAGISVLVPVLRDDLDVMPAYVAYKAALAALGRWFEFVYVLGSNMPRIEAQLRRLKDAGEPVRAVVLSRLDSEGAALSVGCRHATGETVLTVPAQLQVEPADLSAVLEALHEGCDMVVTRRAPLASTRLEALQTTVFHWLMRHLFGHDLKDLVSRVRACRRRVLEEVVSFSTQQHFLPLVALERGFRIREVQVRERREGPVSGLVRRLHPFAWIRLSLDVLGLYVSLKFLRQPLRFFGAIGLPIFAGGLIFTSSLTVSRLFFGTPLADRPALILGVLLIVLGIQVIALGLIGEIIIFAAGKRIRDYTVEEIL